VGKTGTSDQRKDLWFIGFIPSDLVTGVWLGNPTFERKPTNVGSADAAQVWQDYMQGSGY
jgi:penicillin-binding protein 1A